MLHITGVANNGIRSGGNAVFATQNVQFETLTPSISVMDLPETDITARVNTTSATSISDGSTAVDQASIVNDGTYVPVTLNDWNLFDNPRMICSEVNENAKLDGEKSFNMLIDLSTEKSTLSPVVDLDRCSLITTTNRINKWLVVLMHTVSNRRLIQLKMYFNCLLVIKMTQFILLVLQD